MTQLAIFFSASLLLALAPGPDNIFVLTQSALHGRRAGVYITLGLCTGLLVHTALVALGVAVIFSSSAIAFNVLKIVGALYLLYLAWQAFCAPEASLDAGAGLRLSTRQLYLRGIVMNVTNPKVSIFFLAFLPQFVDPVQGGVATQVTVLGALFIAATLLVFGGVAMLAGTVGEWLRKSPGAQTAIRRLAGCIFAALAFRLLLMEP